MSSFPRLSIDAIRRGAGSSEVFKRGETYQKRGAVTQATLREDGTVLTADVEGSDVEPYEVIVRFNGWGGITDAECTCPYGEEWDGWCKHIVATLLLALHTPEKVRTAPPLTDTLADLDAADMEAILLRLAHDDPRLADVIVAAARTLTGRAVSR
jgi:uncharacterized Zn finger protein